MPPLVTQILLKLATILCVWICTKLQVKFTTADIAETATWFVSLVLGIASFALATWRHWRALQAAKQPATSICVNGTSGSATGYEELFPQLKGTKP